MSHHPCCLSSVLLPLPYSLSEKSGGIQCRMQAVGSGMALCWCDGPLHSFFYTQQSTSSLSKMATLIEIFHYFAASPPRLCEA